MIRQLREIKHSLFIKSSLRQIGRQIRLLFPIRLRVYQEGEEEQKSSYSILYWKPITALGELWTEVRKLIISVKEVWSFREHK